MRQRERQTENDREVPFLTEPASRHDMTRALAIEIAIGLSHLLGTRIAAQFLKKHQLDIDVALRVLLQPEQRRHYQTLSSGLI